jgi:hypothetical protein
LVQEVAAELIFADFGGRRFAVISELWDGAEVSGVGAFAHTGQVQVFGHAVLELAEEVGGMGSGHRGVLC